MRTTRGWDVVDQRYSTRGLVAVSGEPERMFNPVMVGMPLFGSTKTTTMKYDQLGRPILKLAQRDVRSNDVPTPAYGSAFLYRTEYVHSGFKTDIKVCGVGLSGNPVCPAPLTLPAITTNSFGKVLSQYLSLPATLGVMEEKSPAKLRWQTLAKLLQVMVLLTCQGSSKRASL
jgi:hypothetical protein